MAILQQVYYLKLEPFWQEVESTIRASIHAPVDDAVLQAKRKEVTEHLLQIKE